MRKRYLCALFAALSALFVAVAALQTRNNLPTVADSRPLILLDAGHGGFDGGTVASDDTVEKDINLEVTTDLSVVLRLLGYRVSTTRKTDTALDDDPTKTIRERKRADMAARLALYDTASLVISIHQNHFPDASCRGTQVFYSTNHPDSEVLAEKIRQATVSRLQPDNRRACKAGSKDILLLHKTTSPAVIVECGFLSNPEERALLKSEHYRRRLALAFADGIVQFQPT